VLLVVDAPFPPVTTTLNLRPLYAAEVAKVVMLDVVKPVPAAKGFHVEPERYCQA
jgi:hypothetical protein